VYPNVVEKALSRIGISRYCFRSEYCNPPQVVNCYMFVAWAFAECGFFIPNSLEGQLYCGDLVDPPAPQDGDFVFTTGRNRNYFTDNDRAIAGVGHVGILTAERLVVHASRQRKTVVALPLMELLSSGLQFRGIYRFAP
jgi:cell wall-associated NlpC family hydrolase